MSQRRRLPNPQLRAVLAAWVLVCSAGWAVVVGLAVYAYARSGAGAVGIVTAVRLLVAMLAAPVSGALLDRHDRRVIVGVACVAQTACIAVTALLIGDHASLVPVTLLAALGAAAATAPRPGLQALLPALAKTPDELTVATAAWSATDGAAFLIGSGLAGAAIAVFGTAAVLAAAAAVTLVAAVVALRLRPTRAAANAEEDEPAGGLSEVFAGVRTVIGSPLLRAPFAMFAGLLIVEGTTDVQLVALAIGKLHLGSGGPGLLYAVWGAGSLLASIAILAVVRRRGYGFALWLGAIVFGLGVALAGVDALAVVLVMMVPAGIGFSFVETAVMAIVPRLADDALVGRVYAVSEVLYAGAAALGALIAPVLISAFGVGGSLVCVGALFGLGALAAANACRHLDAHQEQAGRVRTLLREISFLRPLPLPALERLVRGARPLTAARGETVIRAGEQGHEFFAIEDGAVAIEEYGREQGPGTGFGEIALLNDVPRTATVTAVEATQMWVLDRTKFLAAVTGHGDASRLASTTIAEHLAREPVA